MAGQKTLGEEVSSKKTILEQRYDDTMDFFNTLPVKNRAQAFAVLLIKEARRSLGVEKAKEYEELFKSKEFLKRLATIMEEYGTEGLIEEMKNLDANNPESVYEFLTGEKWIAPGTEEMDMADSDDYLHVDVD